MAPPGGGIKNTVAGVFSSINKNLGATAKATSGGMDPASITAVNTALGEQLSILVKVRQQHEQIGATKKHLEEEIKLHQRAETVLKTKQKLYVKIQEAILKGEKDLSKNLNTQERSLLARDAVLKQISSDLKRGNIDLAAANDLMEDASYKADKALRDETVTIGRLDASLQDVSNSASLTAKSFGALAASGIKYFSKDLKPLLEQWGNTGKLAASNYIDTGGVINDTNRGMVGTTAHLTNKLWEVQGVIGSVALSGAKFGYNLQESSATVSEAMEEIAISSKGALQASDFEKIGKDSLMFSRILGQKPSATVKYFKHSMQSLNKTAEETSEDLLKLSLASSKLTNANGKAIFTTKEFSSMVMSASMNSKSAGTNINSLAGMATIVGNAMQKAGMSVDQTKRAVQGFTEFLASPDEATSFLAHTEIMKEAELAALKGDEGIRDLVAKKYKPELDAIQDITERKKKQQQLEETMRQLARSDVDPYVKQKIAAEQLGNTHESNIQKLKQVRKLAGSGGGKAAAAILDEMSGGKIGMTGSQAIMDELKKVSGSESNEEFERILKLTESMSGTPSAATRQGVEDRAQVAGVFAGGIDKLPENMWKGFLENPIMKLGWTALAAASTLYIAKNKAGNAIDIVKGLFTQGGGGVGASAAAKATSGVVGNASATAKAASGFGKTIPKFTSALGSFAKKIPVISGLVNLGLGAHAYANATTDKERSGVVGKTAGSIAGGLTGGAIGTWLGAALAPWTAGLSLVAGPLIGTALGDWLGGKGGEYIGKNADAVWSTLTDAVKDAVKWWKPLVETAINDYIVPGLKILKSLLESLAVPVQWLLDKLNLSGPGTVLGAVADKIKDLSGDADKEWAEQSAKEIAEKREALRKRTSMSAIPASIQNPQTGDALSQQQELKAQQQAAMSVASAAASRSGSGGAMSLGEQRIDLNPPNSVGDRTGTITIRGLATA